MLLKLTKQHGKNPHFHKPKATNSPLFGIIHFAGTVYYDTRGVCTHTVCGVGTHACTIGVHSVIVGTLFIFPPHHSLPSLLSTSLGFLEKNRDTFSADLFDLLHTTKNPFLASLFSGDKAMVRNTTLYIALTFPLPPTYLLPFLPPPFPPLPFPFLKCQSTETRKKAPTLGPQFKRSLDQLMKTLEACQPFFVRCIKPNEEKAGLVGRSPPWGM